MTPERKVKNEVVKILKAYNAWYCFPATHGYGASGTPDILVCFHGVFIGIECKAGKNKPTKLQARAIDAIRGSGGIAVVVNEETVGEVQKLLSALVLLEGLGELHDTRNIGL